MQCGFIPVYPDRLNWNFRISEKSPAFTAIEKRTTPQSYIDMLPRVDEFYMTSR